MCCHLILKTDRQREIDRQIDRYAQGSENHIFFSIIVIRIVREIYTHNWHNTKKKKNI